MKLYENANNLIKNCWLCFDCNFPIFFRVSSSNYWSPLIEIMDSMYRLTLMLLVADLSSRKWCIKTYKWLKPWHMGTPLRVLSESYQMNTNMTGFRWFSEIFESFNMFWTKVASALEGLTGVEVIIAFILSTPWKRCRLTSILNLLSPVAALMAGWEPGTPWKDSSCHLRLNHALQPSKQFSFN